MAPYKTPCIDLTIDNPDEFKTYGFVCRSHEKEEGSIVIRHITNNLEVVYFYMIN
jgi:hypothetical protein